MTFSTFMNTIEIRGKNRTGCESCGAPFPARDYGCQDLFEEILAKEFGDYRFGRLHRLTVDTFSLQHPERYMRSGKSFAAHLTGICAALEKDGAATIHRAVQSWLSGRKTMERPPAPPPGKRGKLTIFHLQGDLAPEEHLKRIREWAISTWSAWGGYHDLARQWIDRATSKEPR